MVLSRVQGLELHTGGNAPTPPVKPKVHGLCSTLGADNLSRDLLSILDRFSF